MSRWSRVARARRRENAKTRAHIAEQARLEAAYVQGYTDGYLRADELDRDLAAWERELQDEEL